MARRLGTTGEITPGGGGRSSRCGPIPPPDHLPTPRMSHAPERLRRRAVAVACGCLIALAVVAAPARGEFPRPRLGGMFPPGGRAGSSVEVTLTGGDLDEVDRLVFSHPGITATPSMLAAGAFDTGPRPAAGRFTVTVAADVPPGIYDCFSAGRFGVSNPRAFAVAALPEVVKTAAIDTPAAALDIPTDATVSARTQAGAADHYAVHLTAGQRLHVEAWAKRIDSRMSPRLAVLGPAGREVAGVWRFDAEDPAVDVVATAAGRHTIRVHDLHLAGGDEHFYRLTVSTGPVIDAVFPPAGTPGAATKLTVIGRGLPGGSPAIVAAGRPEPDGAEQVQVEATLGDAARGAVARTAWRLLSPRDAAADLVDARGGLLAAADVPPAVLATDAAVVVEHDANDDPAAPQPLLPPTVVAGRFHPRGDRDWYAFPAKAGEQLVFDLHSRRLGLPTDATLLVESVAVDADGRQTAKEVAFADDGPAEFPGGMLGRGSHDPSLTFTAPADGTYRVLVRELGADSQTRPEHAYVLEVRRPAPDFRVLVILAQPDRGDANKLRSATPVLARGGSVALDVLVVREDGFAGPVTIAAGDLPAGVTAAPVLVPEKGNRATLVLVAAADAPPMAGTFLVVGTAAGAAGDIRRTARAAALRWDVEAANRPALVRETAVIPLAVIPDSAPCTVTVSPQPREAARGKTLTIPLSIVRHAGAKGPLTLSAAGLPADLKVPEVKIDEQATAANVAIECGPKLALGPHAIVLRGLAKLSFARNPQAADRAKADAARVAEIAKDRAGRAADATAALAAAETALAGATAAGTAPPADLVAARDAAAMAVAETAAAAKAAEQERAVREKAAADAVAASAAKDIDVPVVLPPIELVVVDAPAATTPTPEPPPP